VAFVIDASVTMAWCFEDEATRGTDELLGRLATEDAYAPSVWPLEVTNVLLVAERRGRLVESKAMRFVALLDQLPIAVDPHVTIGDLLAGGRRHALSAYDAAYLFLAQRLAMPLATLDNTLAAAAHAAGVELVLPRPQQ